MKVHSDDIQQRLGFIDRTIDHAMRACHKDNSVPDDMRHYVNQLGQGCCQARQALLQRDASRVRQSVDDLARISDQAQTRLHPADGMNYELKSAVILTHIELSALQYQLDG
jgi:hypothetical protein